MSTTTKPAPKRPRRAKLVPLLMLGSDGECYACAAVADVPEGLLRNPNAVVAIRLNRRESAAVASSAALASVDDRQLSLLDWKPKPRGPAQLNLFGPPDEIKEGEHGNPPPRGVPY